MWYIPQIVHQYLDTQRRIEINARLAEDDRKRLQQTKEVDKTKHPKENKK